MRFACTVLVVAIAACGTYSPPPPPPAPAPPALPPARTAPGGAVLQDLVSGTTERLQAVSAVNEEVVWASGTGGTWAVSLNGGLSWRTGVVPAADSLEFRDVQAVDGRTAYLLSSGTGPNSRIYKTTDGGQNWQLQFINRDPKAFYDCFAFWDRESGIAFSDNVGGRFPLIHTRDGGLNWNDLATAPEATQGEGAFAASGTCVATLGKSEAWVATGAGQQARILYTPDRGSTWKSFLTPIVQGTSTTGHTTVTFRTERDGMTAGGDIARTDSTGVVVALTRDGGRHWDAGGHPAFKGPVYGAAYVPGAGGRVVAVGPLGASWSPNDGQTWEPLDTLGYWSVTFASRHAGWLVGPGGRVTKVRFPD